MLNSVLKHPPELPTTPTVQLSTCENTQIISCGDCQHDLSQPTDAANQTESSLDHLFATECHFSSRQASVTVPERLQRKAELCVVNLCNATVIYSKLTQKAHFVKGILSEPILVEFIVYFLPLIILSKNINF